MTRQDTSRSTKAITAPCPRPCWTVSSTLCRAVSAMNSDPPVWEEVRQGFLLSFCSQTVSASLSRYGKAGRQRQSGVSGRSRSASRSGISRTFNAAASIASACVGKGLGRTDRHPVRVGDCRLETVALRCRTHAPGGIPATPFFLPGLQNRRSRAGR
jgi:hypothetical protein